MKVHEFFQKYANTPMNLRFVPIYFSKAGNMTLNDVFVEMHLLENQMRSMKLREEELLKLAESVLR